MIAFHRVKKSPPITAIKIKLRLNIVSSYFHSASQRCPILSANCTFRHILRLFRLFRGDRSRMDKSSSARCLLYSDVVKGDPSPIKSHVAKEISGRGRRRSREKGNQGVVSWIFYNFLLFVFFSITLGYHFFLTFCTHEFIHTHTHGPHPRLLATLMTCFLLFDKLICDYIYRTAFCGRQFE